MNGEVATFMLSSFDEFVTSYKTNNNALASEAVEAFNHFLPTLDKFFTGRNKKYRILANRTQIRHKSAKCIANRQIRNISYKKSEKLPNSVYPICDRFTTYFRYISNRLF